MSLGADLEAKARNGSAPLHFAAFYNNIKVAKILLDRGANVNTVNNASRTPLDTAHKKYSNNEDYKNITELLEEAAHNRTAINSMKDIIASNTSNGIVNIRNGRITTTPSDAAEFLPRHKKYCSFIFRR